MTRAWSVFVGGWRCCLVPMAIMVGSTLAAIVTSAPAGAAGYLPPSNPSREHCAEQWDWLASINAAAARGRGADEHLGVATRRPSDRRASPHRRQRRADRSGAAADQLRDVTTRLLRTGRCQLGQRPVVPLELERGRTPHVRRRGGPVASRLARGRLLLDVRRRVERLVDDERRACGGMSGSECWGHRDIILHEFPTARAACRCCRWAVPSRRAATPVVR